MKSYAKIDTLVFAAYICGIAFAYIHVHYYGVNMNTIIPLALNTWLTVGKFRLIKFNA